MAAESLFLYMYLCLFDNILTAVLNMLPLTSIVDGAFNPINLHKGVIIPYNAIGTYHFALHKDSNLNAKIKRPFGRLWEVIGIFVTDLSCLLVALVSTARQDLVWRMTAGGPSWWGGLDVSSRGGTDGAIFPMVDFVVWLFAWYGTIVVDQTVNCELLVRPS